VETEIFILCLTYISSIHYIGIGAVVYTAIDWLRGTDHTFCCIIVLLYGVCNVTVLALI